MCGRMLLKLRTLTLRFSGVISLEEFVSPRASEDKLTPPLPERLPVPKVHTRHATIKFTLPVLTVMGQAITDIAVSVLPIVITLPLVIQYCHLAPVTLGHA